jgi:hypothetical protein
MIRVIYKSIWLAAILWITQAVKGQASGPDHDGEQQLINADSSIYTHRLDTLQEISANKTPSSTEEAFHKLSIIHESKAHSLLDGARHLISHGLASLKVDGIHAFLEGMSKGEGSDSNVNDREPSEPIYPKVASGDASYSIPEAKLRGAIYIPTTFRYGAADASQPILLVGGTGNPGYVTYAGSYIPLLQSPETSFGDPVWLNLPGYSLEDIQTNAEYVAYAIQYISRISSDRSIAVFGYSQGNLDSQWAYKNWPSTRERVTDHVAFSPGYHGTRITELLAAIPQPPAWLQSTYDSDFVAALRADGGDSAYVPTTIIYSSTDQVVQPQTGDGASSPLKDERDVGVSNVLVQDICPGKPAGSFYTHESVMVNPIAYALAKDAVFHDGPGQVSRLKLDDICEHYLAPTLTLDDFILTENSAVFAAGVTLLYKGKSLSEPAIRSEYFLCLYLTFRARITLTVGRLRPLAETGLVI